MKALTWLASFRLRILFRTSFLLLALAVVAMAVAVLQEEKAAQLRQLSGELRQDQGTDRRPPAPPGRAAGTAQPAARRRPGHATAPGHAAFFGHRFRRPRQGPPRCGNGRLPGPVQELRQSLRRDRQQPLGRRLHLCGRYFRQRPSLVPHRIGNEFLDGAHRLRVVVSLRGERYRWLAPFEVPSHNERRRASGMRGRFTGYVELDDRDYTGEMPVKEFRGWVWQSGSVWTPPGRRDDCEKKSFFSLRLPIEVLSDALFQPEKPQWPPPDLDQFQVASRYCRPATGRRFSTATPTVPSRRSRSTT
jgi:hypothetical protein